MKSSKQNCEFDTSFAVGPVVEAIEARQLLSVVQPARSAPVMQSTGIAMPLAAGARSGATRATAAATFSPGEYHGVLEFSNFPAGAVSGVQAGSFSTRVILVLQSANTGNGLTGALNA